ncbi:MAG: histidine phosphatase family protein [Campylobacterota bacterium]|nr:histidine phosphatase family protein [Campylobacterota bacterium]
MKKKTLYLLRHAKSSWKDLSIRDFNRPLNKRGKRDAPFMAKLMQKKGIHPDIILSSPAKRAKTTAKHFAKALESELLLDEAIYEASPSTLRRVIREAFGSYDEVMLVGHNPSLTMLCNELSDHFIDNIPTAGIVGIEFTSGGFNKGNVIFFEYPKKEG